MDGKSLGWCQRFC